MNKKVVISTFTLFFAMSIIGFILHGVLLAAEYQAEPMKSSMRSTDDMMRFMWIYYVVYFVQSYLLSFIFFKGYEGKGLSEGVRFGVISGFLMCTGMAFANYAMYPTPLAVALQWFFFGMVEFIVLGCLLALIASKVGNSARNS